MLQIVRRKNHKMSNSIDLTRDVAYIFAGLHDPAWIGHRARQGNDINLTICLPKAKICVSPRRVRSNKTKA